MGWHPFPGNYPDPDPAQKLSVGEQIPTKPKSGSKIPFIKGVYRIRAVAGAGRPPLPPLEGEPQNTTHTRFRRPWDRGAAPKRAAA
jgi:hypothetical protein